MTNHPTKNIRNFRLNSLGAIKCVNANTILTDDPDAATEEIEITVETESGAEFKVLSLTVPAGGGLIGHSTYAGNLKRYRSWEDRIDDELLCPLCLFSGHGAMACERVHEGDDLENVQ